MGQMDIAASATGAAPVLYIGKWSRGAGTISLLGVSSGLEPVAPDSHEQELR